MKRSDFEAFREQVLTNKHLAAQALRQVVLQWRPELRATPLDEFPAIAEATWTRVTGRPVPDTPLAWEKLAARVRAPIPDELDQATLHRLAHLVADYYAEEAGETLREVYCSPDIPMKPTRDVGAAFESDAEPFIPTPLQDRILDALDGRALRKEPLAAKAGCDPRTLHKPSGIPPLKARGRVKHHRSIGYYRPDAPPPEYDELQGHQ